MEPFFPMNKAVAGRTDLSMPAKMVHACLTAYSGMTKAYPSQARIAKNLGISVKTVYRSLKDLEAAGLVVIKRGSFGTSSVYSVAVSVNESTVNESSMDKASIAPRTTSPYHYGPDDRLIEAKESSNRSVASDDEPMTHAERLRWLRGALANFNPSLGLPDAAITQKIEAAAAGATEDDIEAALHRLYDSGLQDRMRSWGLMAVALPEELGKGAA